MHFRNSVMGVSALALIALLSIGACADNVKTISKKVAFPYTPPAALPKEINKKEGAKRNVIETRFGSAGLLTPEQTYSVGFMTPETCIAFTNKYVKDHLLDEADAQKLYESNVALYYGKSDDGDYKDYGTKVGFMVRIALHTKVWKIGAVADGWDFYLYVNNDKRYKPATVVMGSPTYTGEYWTNIATVIFDNIDPDVKKPFLTSETKSIGLAIASVPRQFKVQFEFTPPKK